MRILSPDSAEYQEIAALWDKWNKALKEGQCVTDTSARPCPCTCTTSAWCQAGQFTKSDAPMVQKPHPLKILPVCSIMSAGGTRFTKNEFGNGAEVVKCFADDAAVLPTLSDEVGTLDVREIHHSVAGLIVDLLPHLASYNRQPVMDVALRSCPICFLSAAEEGV